MFSLSPPKKITRGFYKCSSRFYLDDIIPLYEDHENFGGIVLSGNEMRLYKINDYECSLLFKKDLHQLKHHKKGGQSAPRFQRLRDNKKDQIVDFISECVWEHFYDSSDNILLVKGLLIGGPADLKNNVIATDLFQKYFKDHLICCQNLPKVDDKSIYELFEQSKNHISNHEIEEEQKILDELQEIMEINSDVLRFGQKEILEKLEEGMLKKIIGTKNSHQFNRIKELAEKTGAEFIILETHHASSQILRNYGGWMGVQWFSYLDNC